MDDISALAIRLTAGHLELLDQQRLPHEERWLTIASTDELITAIHDLSVRGAPLIGVAAALWLGELADSGCAPEHWAEDAARVRAVRPTAVNLAWAVDRMLARAEPWQPAVLVAEAAAI